MHHHWLATLPQSDCLTLSSPLVVVELRSVFWYFVQISKTLCSSFLEHGEKSALGNFFTTGSKLSPVLFLFQITEQDLFLSWERGMLSMQTGTLCKLSRIDLRGAKALFQIEVFGKC